MQQLVAPDSELAQQVAKDPYILEFLGGGLSGCSAFGKTSYGWGPAQPYAHDPMEESSVAVPVPSEGETGRIARALEEAVYFCAQVPANQTARQNLVPGLLA